MGGKPSKSEPAEPELENPELTKSQKVSATLVAGKEAAAKGLGAAAASVGSVFDKGKPKAQAAWGWTKQGAADSYDATRIFFSDGLGSTAEMAVCEAKFRTARSRLQADKKDFGERILESLVAECGDALASPKGGRCVGCLRDGSDALQLYTEAQAKFKEHEEAMAAARKEYEELKVKVKATWKVDAVSDWVNKKSDAAVETYRELSIRKSSPKKADDGAAAPEKKQSWFGVPGAGTKDLASASEAPAAETGA